LNAAVDPGDWADFVLSDFTSDEAELVADLVDHATKALLFWLENDLEQTLSRFNRRIRPES